MRLADKIKLELMNYYRFQRQYNYVCSEGIHNADVNAFNGTSLIEVEIKISKADFKHEFDGKARWKVYKHKNYSEPKQHLLNGYIIPNRFYFCVPIVLKEWALDYLKDKNKNYGLLVYNTEFYNGNYHIFTAKNAKSIHTEKQESRTLMQLAQRMSSEMLTAKQKLNDLEQELECIRQGIIREAE